MLPKPAIEMRFLINPAEPIEPKDHEIIVVLTLGAMDERHKQEAPGTATS